MLFWKHFEKCTSMFSEDFTQDNRRLCQRASDEAFEERKWLEGEKGRFGGEAVVGKLERQQITVSGLREGERSQEDVWGVVFLLSYVRPLEYKQMGFGTRDKVYHKESREHFCGIMQHGFHPLGTSENMALCLQLPLGWHISSPPCLEEQEGGKRSRHKAGNQLVSSTSMKPTPRRLLGRIGLGFNNGL